jgi:hypothetical protein
LPSQAEKAFALLAQAKADLQDDAKRNYINKMYSDARQRVEEERHKKEMAEERKWLKEVGRRRAAHIVPSPSLCARSLSTLLRLPFRLNSIR